MPKDRFDVKTHYDASGKAMNTSHTPYGCWIENPGLFDPRFFNMSPREALQTDPMQRLALSTAYEALEMSGYVPNRTPSTKLDRIGTFYGQTSDDWREINAAQEVDTYFITGGVRAFGPGRINYHFGFSGPSFSVDTACSSSMAAIQIACTSLWAQDCDTAIVGGLSCMTNSDIFAGLSRGQFLSKTGPCATFDNEADGYCRADGIGTVIIKRLEDAQADKDNILAVVLGTATNHSADAISITHPHGPTQEVLFRSVLDRAGVDPLDIDYVEMHGTGTQAGDGTEMRSVTNVFAPADRKRSDKQPLYLGAVKANIGHGEAASGVTALIKTLLMLQKNAIPPHVGIKNTINKTFPTDLAERNVNIAFHKTPLLPKQVGQPRRIFINNFSAAGGNTALLIEDGPTVETRTIDPRSMHVVTVSGKSKSAMVKNVERLLQHLIENPETSMSDLSYTTTARKIHHNWRTAITASDIAQTKANLMVKLNTNLSPVLPTPPKVAFLFTGQGSHYAALGKELLLNSALFRNHIMAYDQLAKLNGLPSFLPLIDGSVDDVALLSPIVVQVGLVCFEMAMARLWTSWGITPNVVVGHSLGEYAALHIAGVLSASDTIYLVGIRASRLVEQCTAGTHVMLAVQGPLTAVTDALDTPEINVACINGPHETVLSGTVAQMAKAAGRLGDAGFKCTQLKVPFAFHSAQVDPILDSFERTASSVHFEKAKIPIISPLLGRILGSVEAVDAIYLRKHARDPVDFLGAIVSASQADIVNDQTVWVEVGPHPVCLNMVKATFGAATIAIPTLRRNENAWHTLTNSLCGMHSAGLKIDWEEYHRDFSDSVRLLDLPSYAFDDKNYWIQYEGDWCLSKGRISTSPHGKIEDDRKEKISTTTVHRVIEENFDSDTATVTTESDLARSDLRAAVMGHLVNGTGLCPSSIYADMAMTICDYAYKLLRPEAKNVVTNVAQMEVFKPLIAQVDASSQIIRLKASVNAITGHASLVFSSGSDNLRLEHAKCQVFFGNGTVWLSEWERSAYLVQSRIESLRESEMVGRASKLGRGLVYKLFGALVDYDPKYRGMEEVILDSDKLEATAHVVFQTTEKDGNFLCSPYWIDSVCHLSGFIVNGSDAVDSRNQVYISHGWESLRFAERLSATKTYRSYVKMQPAGGKMVAGDVYIFDQDRVIGVVGGLKFQCIPRTLLNTFLPPIGAAAITPARPAPMTRSPKVSKLSKIEATENAQVNMSNLSSLNEKLRSVRSQAFDILVKEIGVSRDELVDNIAFDDLGVDSLMSLTVSGRIREDLEIEVQSTAFIDHPTVGAFMKYLAQFEAAVPSRASLMSKEEDSDETTPDLESASSNITTPPDDTASESGKEGSLSDIIRTTIADEMGVGVQDISEMEDLSTMGMDSLMSLTILGSLREKTGLSLPSDLLTANPTILRIERALNVGAPVCIEVASLQPVVIAEPKPVVTPARIASAILLQGNPRTATKQVWMIPDGSGSATSYVDIPEIGPAVAVWGLNSPFMKTPEEYTCGVIGMSTHFLNEIRRRQPHGPYIVAGWSAGGVMAFEAVNQLLIEGEQVEHLILIDAPSPIMIEPLPKSLHLWFAETGVIGTGDLSKTPPWLLPHFAASVAALGAYKGVKLNPERSPKVLAVFCEDGVCKYPDDPKPDPYPLGHAQWLLENRTDFGPHQWDEYLNGDKIVTKRVPGHHFSMMKPPHVSAMSGTYLHLS